jgi:glycyl-tRNA synthetase
MIDAWRKHFVLQESMLEMECTCLTPEAVLKTSGHVDRFTDLMVKDPEGGQCFRADKLLEDVIDELLEANPTMPTEEREAHLRVQRQADAYSPEELDALLLQYNCKAPSGQPYSASFPFNLMFKTSIGPEGTSVGYLRPETAQGLFVNFKRLLDANAQKMPFAAAQIGLGFRNGRFYVCPVFICLVLRSLLPTFYFHKRNCSSQWFASRSRVLHGRD